MRKTMAWACLAALPLTMLSTLATAQEPAEAPKARKAAPEADTPKARKAVTPLKVLLVISKYQGEKKVSSLPYSFVVNAEDRKVKLRMGIEVPVLVSGGKDGARQYRNVGTNIDCWAETDPSGRFKLVIDVEQSSIYSAPADGKSANWATGDVPVGDSPLFRSFNVSFSAVLSDGQSGQYTAVPDPVSGDVMKVDVTLSVVK